ncbi:MAG TPA: hypothetical protein K8V90_01505 [Romboutsia timonensis]|uniref:Uncharacterized protein n=1 Tax=Romboutsia timonensis TaxID=1776391 RepID=A0A921MZ98_9FIRM|nr:hypothetical protein [Romboutsia timonensis]
MRIERCYNCDGELIGEYQVMIYEPNLQFVKCCCMDCAEELKKANEEILYDRSETVRRQVIRILKKCE